MESSMIQGVGDEVLLFFSFFTVFVGAAIILYFRSLLSQQVEPVTVHNLSQNNSDNPNPRTFESDVCPICLGPHRLAVQTNCGHTYCGPCINRYIIDRNENDLANLLRIPGFAGIGCPMCRQKVTLLLPCFTGNPESDSEERREVETMVADYNIHHGTGYRSWSTLIRDCPVLVRHLFRHFFSPGGLIWLFRLRVIGCAFGVLLYFLMPLDLFPEALFGFIGLLDDVVIVFLCAIYLSIIYRRFILSRSNPENRINLEWLYFDKVKLSKLGIICDVNTYLLKSCWTD